MGNTEFCHDGKRHKFVFAGIVYDFNNYSELGGSGRKRFFEDKFFCEVCLHTEYRNKRYDGGDQYSAIIPNTHPK